MDQPSSTDDLLLALAGSSIFWSILAGMAIKTLKLDAGKLEAFLKDAYEKADAFTFNAAHLSEVAIFTTLHAVYGIKVKKVVYTTLVASLVMNAYILFSWHRDWGLHSKQITEAEHYAVQEVSPKYYALMQSARGREKLQRALHVKGTARAFYYDNNTPEDIQTRHLFKDFNDRIDQYGQDHHLSYELTLSRMFGDSLADYAWRNTQSLDLLIDFAFMVLGNCAVDTLAFFVILRCLEALFRWRIAASIAYLSGAVVLFGLSLLNYGAVFVGKEAGAAILIAVAVGLTAFAVVAAYQITDSETLGEGFIRVSLVFGFVGGLSMWSAYVAEGGFVEAWTSLAHIPYYFVTEWVNVVFEGMNSKAIVMAMETMLPLICAGVVLAVVYAGKVFMVSAKEMFLWSVLGNSKIAGGTYFTGFLTTVISSTYLIAWLIHLISSHSHRHVR